MRQLGNSSLSLSHQCPSPGGIDQEIRVISNLLGRVPFDSMSSFT